MPADKLTELLSKAPSWLRLFNRKYQLKAIIRMNELLEEKGLTQKVVAERADWSKGYVSRILSGRENITLRTLARFEDAVGADVLTVTSKPKLAITETRKVRQKPAETNPSEVASMGPGETLKHIGFLISHSSSPFDPQLIHHYDE